MSSRVTRSQSKRQQLVPQSENVAPIVTLPTELLLEVIDHLPHLPLDRRTALVALSRVNKQISAVAKEILHKNVCVHVKNVPRLLDLYLASPNIAEYVRSLEFYGRVSDGSLKTKPTRQDVSQVCCPAARGVFASKGDFCSYHQQEYVDRTTAYANFVWNSGLPKLVQKDFIQGLLKRRTNAPVTVLLLLLQPNMQGLYLGRLDSFDLELHFGFRGAGPKRPRETSIQNIFDLLAPKLTTLELPCGRFYHDPREPNDRTPMDLSHCTALTTLITPYKALMREWHPFYTPPAVQGPEHASTRIAILPPTLRRLTIEGGYTEDITATFLRHLIDVYMSGSLPNLRQMGVYIPFGTDLKTIQNLCRHYGFVDTQTLVAITHIMDQFERLGVTARIRNRRDCESCSTPRYGKDSTDSADETQ